MKRFVLPALVLLTSGCSLMPYENEFACRLKNNLGKCISVAEAYEEAVTGVEKAPYMTPASEQESHDDTPREPLAHQRNKERYEHLNQPYSPVPKPVASAQVAPPPPQAAYPGYRDAVYTKLKGLVEQPQAPMVAAPRTVRTMILPYTSSLERNRLWMPRYVYNIVQEPYFILGEYLVKDRELDIINRANTEQ